ncbi:extracellular solute-binding protein [Arcanobacterium hippocoleae]
MKVKIEEFSWDEFNTKWTTGLNAGQVPDIATAQPNQVIDMLNAEAIVPLDDVIDRVGKNRFNAPTLKEGEKSGSHYSIPIYSHAQVMWYRKDILDQYGIAVPKTWEELAAACAKIGKSADLYPISVPMGANDMLATRYINFYLRAKGETLLNEDGSANITSPAAIEAINYWAEMYRKYSPEGSINYKILDHAKLFYQGKTVFDFNSGFHISGTLADRPDLDGKIAAAPMPRAAAGDPEIYPSEVSNIAMVVWQASKHQDVAKAFLASLYEKDEYVKFLHSVPGGMLPSLQDINQDPVYNDNETMQKYKDSIAVIAKEVAVGSAIGMEDGPKVQAGVLISQGVLERMLQSIVLDGKDTAEAAAEAEKKYNELFKAAGAAIK